MYKRNDESWHGCCATDVRVEAGMMTPAKPFKNEGLYWLRLVMDEANAGTCFTWFFSGPQDYEKFLHKASRSIEEAKAKLAAELT